MRERESAAKRLLGFLATKTLNRPFDSTRLGLAMSVKSKISTHSGSMNFLGLNQTFRFHRLLYGGTCGHASKIRSEILVFTQI